MSFNYPVGSGPPVGAPKCYGSGYNADDRECRSCPYQGPCKDIVVRSKWQQQQQPQQQVPAFAAPFPQGTFQPVQVRNFQPPTAFQAQPAAPQQQRWGPVPQQPPPPPQQQQPQRFGGVYGAVQDPLFGVLHGAPTPFRPQQPGEEFMERWAKNMFLAAFESMAKELVVGIRQMLWGPPQPPPPPASNQTIDMNQPPRQ